MVDIRRSFRYPERPEEDSRRMCSAGQRRAVDEAMKLYAEDQSGHRTPEVDDILRRGLRALRLLPTRATLNKHDVISAVVVQEYMNGTLGELVNQQGDYLLETHSGESFHRNLGRDITQGRRIF